MLLGNELGFQFVHGSLDPLISETTLILNVQEHKHQCSEVLIEVKHYKCPFKYEKLGVEAVSQFCPKGFKDYFSVNLA